MKNLVLIGAGHAHVEVIRAFAEKPAEGARLTVISPYARVPYTGMIPGFVAGKYSFEEVSIDAAALSKRAGADLIAARAEAVDRGARRVICSDGSLVAYDVLSIDIGGVARDPLKGEGVEILGVKPVEPFIERLAALLEKPSARIAIIGGGAGGAELAGALAHRGAKVSLLAGREGLLPRAPEAARRAVRSMLEARAIDLIDGADAVSMTKGAIRLDGGREIAVDAAILAAGVDAPPLIDTLVLPADAKGFLSVDATLKSAADESVFAAGDCAHVAGSPPKAGVYAVRAGPVLAANLRAALQGRDLAAFHPQPDFLAILSFWPDGAVAMRSGLAVSGRWVDRWKEWIDRRFIARYADAS